MYVTMLISSGVAALIISILQFSGFVVQMQKSKMIAVLSGLTVIYFIIINGPVGSPKYRMPIEPILIVWLGCALLSLSEKIESVFYRRTKS